MKFRKIQSNFDVTLTLLILFLGAFGLIMIYSTSYYNAAKYYSDATLYLRRQAIFLAVGFIGMLIVSTIDYHWYVRTWKKVKIKPVYGLYVLCLILTAYLFFNGYSAGGSARWIEIPGVGNFQPSELVKILIIIMSSYLAAAKVQTLSKFYGFLGMTIWFVPFFIATAIQNLSTAIILAGIHVVICFTASRKRGYYFIIGILMLVIGYICITKVGYRSNRIDIWRAIETHPDGGQIREGLYAIASGGLFGKGLGNSFQKLGYIPEIHTDMIFTIICEELGIFGAIAIIALYLMLIYRLYRIADKAPDLFGTLIASGVMIHIAMQVIINIAVVTNTIPATGIPLPFISYGGTSLSVLMAEMGLALSVSRYTDAEEESNEVA